MAEIQPFRAWRYSSELSTEIENLTSPLFDVVSEKQRKKLYNTLYNSVHLSVPSENDQAYSAAKRLSEWKDNKVIEQDPVPGIYVYYQHFSLPGSQKKYCRKGFICNIKAYDWDENVILRHENTIPKAVNDRIDLLKATELNVSPTHGLYTDSTFALEKYMDESMKSPLYETEDYQGVRDVLSVIHDKEVIKRFMHVLKEKPVILADGHHRYEGSLQYRKDKMKENPQHTGDEGYNFHMMFLTNTESDDLRILPTHRVISGLPNFDEAVILSKLEEDFTIKPVEEAHTIHEVILGKPWAFGLIFKDNAYKVRLKPEALDKNPWDFPDEVKKLDLTIMHYFIIDKVLGIEGKDQRSSENINFERSIGDCLTQVITGKAQMAIITNEISMDDVKKVCYSGKTMPQKSTYFYPKVICGFLFSSIKNEEFRPIPDPCF
ncbi:DUF1015 domain-containing protein [Fulvivirga sediminis]|uniref:DUF1015 domain-containing protein n=1 Tax=Fulvivirga sediminis TaxID=2803949 RepID=A0A937K0N1_9BACT|nr:DUF1015 domain-containing protein [Fulvivirga sediminis]MBL3655767.1 DUF1015 domain-containing protein [Fulvivirga sediminis]